MSYTLDQLLDATGVSEISGGRLVKKASASEGPDLSKLADRCRRAVEATPDEVVASNHHELAEKTAAVAVIGRTIDEINAIDGSPPGTIKAAMQSQTSDQAAFIKAALDAGHNPYDIAQFVEKNAGIFGKMWRGHKARQATKGFHSAVKGGAKAEVKSGHNLRKWQDIIRKSERVGEAEKAALVSRMRREMGDQSAMNAFSSVRGHGFKDQIKDLRKAVPAAAASPGGAVNPLAASVNVGGKDYGFTGKQLKSMKKPALYLGGGAVAHKAITGGGDKKSGRGPVIITG